MPIDRDSDNEVTQPEEGDTSPLPRDLTTALSGESSTDFPKIVGFQVLGPLGQGGMGTVWKAIQLSTRREVALKLMSERVFASKHAALRFQREVELAAKLDHPHIAAIHEAGMHKGIYFYAMRLVRGLPLDQHIQREKLGHRAILALMQIVCDAVGHAHELGILHRDLKPSNVMVDEKGRPFVLDFGLAKALGEAEADVSTTHEGDIVGTPAYMSPEQAQGHIQDVDTRTDVYALGVMLYTLLGGRHPMDLTGSRFEVLERIVRQEIKPLRQVSSDVDPKIEAVVMKSLSKDRAKRYADGAELASVIRKYLSAVENPAPTSQASPRAHRGLLAALIAAVAIACAFIFWPRDDNVQTTDQAITKSGDPKVAPSNIPTPVFTTVWPLGPADNVVPGLILRPALLPNVKRWNLVTKRPLRAPLDVGISGKQYDCSLSFSPTGDQLAVVAKGDHIRIYDVPSLTLRLVVPGSFITAPWSPDGRWLAAGSWSTESSLQIVNVSQCRIVRRIPMYHVAAAYMVAWSRDSTKVASGGHHGDGMIRIWRLDGTKVTEFRPRGASLVQSLSWGPSEVVAAGGELNLDVYGTDTGTPVLTLPVDGQARFLSWSPDGKWLAAGVKEDEWKDQITIWESTGKPHGKLLGNISRIRELAWSPDSQRLASAGADTYLRVFDRAQGSILGSLKLPSVDGPQGGMSSVAWSPKGQWIAAMDQDGQVGVWHGDTYVSCRPMKPMDQRVPKKDAAPLKPGEPVRVVIDATANRIAEFSQAGQFIGKDATILDEFVYVVEEEDSSYTTLEHDAFMRRIEAMSNEDTSTNVTKSKKAGNLDTPPRSPITNTVDMTLVWIKPGAFDMGSPASEPGRQPVEVQHRVTLSKGFYVGTTEVTQAQWKAVMGNNPSNFKGDDLPVEMVSWDDAVSFCKKLSGKEGKTYRLPTEAEWEYAARAGTTTRYHSGDTEEKLAAVAWYAGNSGNQTQKVGQKEPNAWGLYDMHGNVWEWCSDWQEIHTKAPATDPKGPLDGTRHVLRSGSWRHPPHVSRAANQGQYPPNYRFNDFGFRVVLDDGTLAPRP